MIGSYVVGGRGVVAAEEDFTCIFAIGGYGTLASGQGLLTNSAYMERVVLPREYARLDFSEREILRLFGEAGIRPDGSVFDLIDTEELAGTARFLLERSGRTLSAGRGVGVVQLLLSYVEAVPRGGETPAASYVAKTEQYIKEHLSDPISVDAIAEELGISRGYLRNIFFETHGMSPREYLTEARLGRAEELLRDSERSVTEVAAEVGYTDVLQFSRIFKKHTGQSPSAFRVAKGVTVSRRREERPTEAEAPRTVAVPEPEMPRQRKKDPVWLF